MKNNFIIRHFYKKRIYVKPKHLKTFTASRNPSKVPDSVKLPGVQVLKFEFDDKKENLKVHIFSGLDSIHILFSLQEDVSKSQYNFTMNVRAFKYCFNASGGTNILTKL